jgi:hypothetical protein
VKPFSSFVSLLGAGNYYLRKGKIFIGSSLIAGFIQRRKTMILIPLKIASKKL